MCAPPFVLVYELAHICDTLHEPPQALNYHVTGSAHGCRCIQKVTIWSRTSIIQVGNYTLQSDSPDILLI